MRKLWLTCILAAAACASTDDTGSNPDDRPEVVPPPAGDEGGVDASLTDNEAGPCDDCEYFPEVCTADSLCPNGPFDPGTAGGSFEELAEVTAIRGRSPSDVWVVGSLGAIARFDGTSWTRSSFGRRDTLLGMWLRDTTEIAVGRTESVTGALRLFARGPGAPEESEPPTGDGWRTFYTPLPPESGWNDFNVVSAYAAPGSDSLWAVMTTSQSDTPHSGLVRLRASAPSTFSLGLGPGSACTPGCNWMNGVHGASAADLWAVGASGTTIRITDAESDAPKATLYDSRTSNSLNAVWAASPSDAWSVGAAGTLRHYVGEPFVWATVPASPTTADLNAVWGSSPSDVWAVGDAGVVLHYDGTSWSRVKVAGLGGRRPKLTAVWVPEPGHVWIGGQGVILSLGGKP
jgi:hypothetical protein